MESKAKHIGQVSLLFGTGLASHYLGTSHETSAIIANALGLSTHIAEGIFTLGSHVVAHGVYEGVVKVKDSFKGDVNNDLKAAILSAYKDSFSQIEVDITTEYQVKEKFAGKLMRYVFNKTSKEYEDLTELKEEFFSPLLNTLNNDEAIEEVLLQNLQLNPDELLRKIIEKVTPEFAEKDNVLFDDFISKVCEKFKHYFRHNFLQELKREDKAKTVYFVHLLESIILNTKDINRDFSIVYDFAAQTNQKLLGILENINETDENVTRVKELVHEYYEEVAKKLEVIQNSLKDLVSPVLDKRDRISYQDQFNKYDFKYGYLDFVGRNEELNKLLNFIGKRNDEMKFSWWMVIGPGGMGKSRIAQKLCMMTDGYYSGFLDIKITTKWESWEPEMPTLIIIDYALSKTNQVADIITTLSQRSVNYLYPVRILLLERQETEEWIQKRRPGTELDDTLYKREVNNTGVMLKLNALDDNYSWNLIEQVIKRENISKWDQIKSNKNEILRSVNELNDKHRPLFTFLVAVALASGDNIRNWNTNDLLKNTFLRLENLWVKYVDKSLISDIELILLVNTFCGELKKNEIIDLLEDLDIKTVYGEFIDSYSIISENTLDEENEIWLGLQPDILGEYFILKTIASIIKRNPAHGTEVVSRLLFHSWNINFRNTIAISYMIWTDFLSETKIKDIKYDIIKSLFNQITVSENIDAKKDLAILFTNICAKKSELELNQEAEECADLAIQLDPSQTIAYNNRGVCRTELGKLNLAIEDFSKGLELDKDNSHLYYNRGRVESQIGNNEEAVLWFNKAIELNPTYAHAHNDRGLAYYNLRLYQQSLDDLNTAIKFGGGHTSYNNRGLTKNALGMHDEAVADYNIAISMNNKYALSYFNRSLAKRNLAELYNDGIYLNSALADLDRAIELDNTDADFFRVKGDTLYGLGMKELGCQSLKTAMGMGDFLAQDLYEEFCTSQKKKEFKRNDRVTVRYTNGEIKQNVKYKNVQADIESGRCIITNHPFEK
ncbi:MAG: tetratricopeptide repeat protein [Chitinophagales bacterium]|nr:tetratricopeptide repeat protein [Chitinophagales bacterium]